MTQIFISKKDETFITISGEPHILKELNDCFSFYADGYKFHPSYRKKFWDGKIYLLHRKRENFAEIYYGLINDIIKFCTNNSYEYELDSNIINEPEYNLNELNEFISNLKISAKGEQIKLRDYQEKGFIDSIQHKRQLLLSITSSGKSATIYSIMRFLNHKNLKGLIIVPNVSLIHQLFNDFDDYSSINQWSTVDNVHKIFSGQDKISNKNIFISTYQSLMNIKDSSYFHQFNYIIIDEAHTIKGKELSNILEKCINSYYRIGLTGTIDNCKANINTIIGLTGSINKLNTTKELIERKEVADFNIKCLILKYDNDTKKSLKDLKYQDEIKYLINNEKRNLFIKNLAVSMKSNTIILFNYVSHGKLLYELIKNSKHLNGRNVYFISGEVDGLERERIRNIIEHEDNSIILGTSSIMSTGISIRNLHNIIFCVGTKSSIRLLQSIGRVLRLHNNKNKACIYDIVDDLSYKSHKNFSLLHFIERVKIYNKEQFDYKLNNIDF